MEYKEYLQTDHWKKLAEETKRLAGYRCQVCNSQDNLNTHHRTYERKGDELQTDLVCLCKECHELFHRKVEYADNGPTGQKLITIILEHGCNIEIIKSIQKILISHNGTDVFNFQFDWVDSEQRQRSQRVIFPGQWTEVSEELINEIDAAVPREEWTYWIDELNIIGATQ